VLIRIKTARSILTNKILINTSCKTSWVLPQAAREHFAARPHTTFCSGSKGLLNYNYNDLHLRLQLGWSDHQNIAVTNISLNFCFWLVIASRLSQILTWGKMVEHTKKNTQARVLDLEPHGKDILPEAQRQGYRYYPLDCIDVYNLIFYFKFWNTTVTTQVR
jgi:hypothetical protein